MEPEFRHWPTEDAPLPSEKSHYPLQTLFQSVRRIEVVETTVLPRSHKA